MQDDAEAECPAKRTEGSIKVGSEPVLITELMAEEDEKAGRHFS